MAIAIKLDGLSDAKRTEIFGILHRFADHAGVCDTCNVKTGAHCDMGGHILRELATFEEVKEVPEDFGRRRPPGA